MHNFRTINRLSEIKENICFAFDSSAEWYKGILTDEQLAELENPKPKNRTRGEEHKTRNSGKQRAIQVE
jgi:hypothetical protein